MGASSPGTVNVPRVPARCGAQTGVGARKASRSHTVALISGPCAQPLADGCRGAAVPAGACCWDQNQAAGSAGRGTMRFAKRS